jgi:isopropylmalate/homocitrate/citramalate synthase
MGKGSTSARDAALAALAVARDKLQQLADLQPYLIDLSLRENPFGSCVGQTVEDKLAILPKLRAFGFQNILLGTLDYAYPEQPEVDDVFMQHLRDHSIDMTGGFAFTDIGLVKGGTFTPSPSMLKLQAYGVPNTLHEIYLSPQGMGPLYDFATLMESLPQTVAWLNANVVGDHGGKPRILINVVDGCDAFTENPEQTFQCLERLATLPIEGLSLEDDRGTFMPFQVGAFVQAARSLMPSPLKILVHMHSGGGFENASVIEALLNGADGVWGGLPKRAAIIGHASLGELLANLVRAGNTWVQQTYETRTILPLATSLQRIDEPDETVPEDLPILGTNAYRLTLDFFRQLPERPMDLPPEMIGGTYGFRVAPLGSDAVVLSGRLQEVGVPPPYDPDVLKQMIFLMRQDLIAGQRLVYDRPDVLVDLYQRAGGTPSS